jgi:ATP-dependent DNA helicase PIF1
LVTRLYGGCFALLSSVVTTESQSTLMALYAKTAILTPHLHNAAIVNALGLKAIRALRGEPTCYVAQSVTCFFSSSTQPNVAGDARSFEKHGHLSGMPPFDLEVTAWAPLLCLSNIDLKNGLMNGTKVLCLETAPDAILVRILSEHFFGREVWVFRHDVSKKHNGVTISMRQFPFQLAFSMSIHKSQGQTLTSVGVWLPKPVFCHGQLYVAVGRVTTWAGLFVLDEKTGTYSV